MAALRADTLKAALPAAVYYARALPDMPPPKRAGWVDGGLCPFHADSHRGNFRVNLESGAYTCFACGTKGGDILAFHRELHRLSFAETINDLAQQFLSGGWADE